MAQIFITEALVSQDGFYENNIFALVTELANYLYSHSRLHPT